MSAKRLRNREKFVACLAAWLGLVVLGRAHVHAESEQRRELRTDEAETPEPLTDKPLKATMQNLFLQEDPFPQQNLQVQTGIRVLAADFADAGSLSMQLGGELGLGDSWTLSARVPLSFLPSDERGLGNSEVGVLYSPWVSAHEDFRLTVNLRNVLPSPARTGENAVAHDLNVIGYARWAPLHVQLVATLDTSYGSDMPGLRVRPEVSAAAIVKLEKWAGVLEAAVAREFREYRYLAACGMFVYPGPLELGAAVTFDMTETPLSWGLVGIFTYAFDPPS